MKKETNETLEREQAEVIARYGDVLNEHGPDSREERAFLARYAGDAEIYKLLRCARALRAMFDAFGEMPDPTPPRKRHRNAVSKSK